jgi:hypothetical protein
LRSLDAERQKSALFMRCPYDRLVVESGPAGSGDRIEGLYGKGWWMDEPAAREWRED